MNCLNCGVTFEGRRSDAVYCTDKCAYTFRSRRTYQRPEQVERNQQRRDTLRDESVERLIIYRAKSRAKKLGLDFDLTTEDICIPEHCPVLGLRITFRGGKGRGYHPDSPSLDRIKPQLGYVRGNIRVISARANLLKNDATIEELERVLADLREILK